MADTPAYRTRQTQRRHLTQSKHHEPTPDTPKRSASNTPTQSTPTQLTAPQRLASLLDQPPGYFQQPALQQRVLLSLRSTLPEDTDFALEILLAASSHEPDLVSLTRFPGFVDPLLDFIELYSSPGPFEHYSFRQVRRRSLEATLILRNLLCLESNLSVIPCNPTRLVLILLRAFRSTHAEVDHEFLSLLLDILHSLSSQGLIRLDQPLQPSNTKNILLHQLEPSCVEQPLLSDWSTHLILGLDQLTQSSDRALVLGAYRAWTSIGSVTLNQPLISDFILNPQPSKDGSPPAWSKAIDRALILLALPDVELLMSALDYLYMVTSVHAIARAICTLHRDIYPILKLLLTHLYHQRKTIAESSESLPIPDQRWYFQPAPPSETLRALVELESGSQLKQTGLDSTVRTAPQTSTMSEVHQILLSDAQMNEIIDLPEPRRAQAWMSRAFEACPGAEVQQVTLWLAYKTQFEPFYGPNAKFGPNHQNQMIAPAEAIKLTSDVFPNALPSVTEHKSGEKKFVISGMKVRPKKHVSIWKCHWKECARNPLDEEETGNEKLGVSAHAEKLYQHIIKAHITPRANKCYWLTCTYQASNRTELLYHIRTHVPSIPPSSKKSSAQVMKNDKIETQIALYGDQARCLPFKTFVHQRWESPNSGAYSSENLHHQSELPAAGQPGGGAIGVGFVSLLVMRNLVHAVSEGLNEIIKSLNHEETNQNTMSTRMDEDSPNHPDEGGLDQSQTAIVNLAKLVAGFPTKNALEDGNTDLDLKIQDVDLQDTDDQADDEVYGSGFIEKKLLEFVANDLHLHNLGFDLLKKISSVSKDLHLISKHHPTFFSKCS